MEKKRKKKSKWEKTKKRKRKKERKKKVLKNPWHTFLAVPFKIVPLIVFIGGNPTRLTKRGNKVEERNRLKEVF
jgi:hypothetical protein